MKPAELGNLFWLLPDSPRQRLLLLRRQGSTAGDGLEAFFASTEELLLSTPEATSGLIKEALSGAGGDCLFVDLSNYPGKPHHILSDARNILSALVSPSIGEGNAPGIVMFRVKGSSRLSTNSRIAMLKQLLARCGFRELRTYCFSPSLLTPRHVVPATAAAARIWIGQEGGTLPKKIVKHILVSLGLNTLLFDDHLVVGFR